MILKIVETCNDYGLVNLIHILKNILNLIQLLGPILLIISLTLLFIRYAKNPEDKKMPKRIKNSVLALILLFLVPTLVNATIYLLDDSIEFSTCWNYADREIKLDNQYINLYNTKPSKVMLDSKYYEKGDERKEDNDSSTNISKRIFVGDSRTVQMYAYITGDWSGANFSSGGTHIVGNDIFIAQSGMGLSWMKSTGIREATKHMSNDTALIILMGVNDLYNLNEYINYVNSNYNSWKSKGVKVYYDSVNPCTGSYANQLNNKIKDFNKGIKQGLNPNIKYIDSHSKLMSSGYSTTDGLHYDEKTSNIIYNYIKNNV